MRDIHMTFPTSRPPSLYLPSLCAFNFGFLSHIPPPWVPSLYLPSLCGHWQTRQDRQTNRQTRQDRADKQTDKTIQAKEIGRNNADKTGQTNGQIDKTRADNCNANCKEQETERENMNGIARDLFPLRGPMPMHQTRSVAPRD